MEKDIIYPFHGFLRAERIFKMETEAYYYRENPNSVTHQMDHEKITRKMDNSLEVILHLQKLLDKIPVAERQALSRRIAQLSMDYLVNNIRLKHSLIALNHAIKKLAWTLSTSRQGIHQEIYRIQKDDRCLYVGRMALSFSSRNK